METYKQRIKRFNDGPPIESLGTLTNSINNFFIDAELKHAYKYELWNLLFIGTYNSIETLTTVFFGPSGNIKNLRRYHEEFIDDADHKGCNFSNITKEINEWRNALVHDWLNPKGHYLGFDPKIQEGWKRDKDKILHFNPKIYFECFQRAFEANGKIWDIETIFTSTQLKLAKDRLINKFIKK